MTPSSAIDPSLTSSERKRPSTSSTVKDLAYEPGVPLFGSAFEALKDPLELFRRTLRDKSIARFRFVYLDYFLLNDPVSIQHVLVGNAANYTKSRNYAGLKAVLGNGLLTSEGEHWKKQRRLAQPAFHREKLRGFAETMTSCTAAMCERWKSETAELELHEEMMRVTFRIVGLTLLTKDFDGEAREVGEAMNVALTWANEYAEAFVRVPPWVPTPGNLRFKRAKARLHALILEAIAERRASGEQKDDLLGMLMSARDEATGEPMSDAELVDELLTLVLAGHETTANALTFALHQLAKHPEIRAAAESEVDTVLGGKLPQLEDVKRLDTIRCIVEETMRLYPPAWVFERQALAEDVVGGVRIPKGAIIGMSPFALHRSPALFSDPERFDPERMRDKSKIGKYDYLPFGAGPRFCIGNSFALMEMQLVLAIIVQKFRVNMQTHALPLDPATTLRPRERLPIKLEARA